MVCRSAWHGPGGLRAQCRQQTLSRACAHARAHLGMWRCLKHRLDATPGEHARMVVHGGPAQQRHSDAAAVARQAASGAPRPDAGCAAAAHHSTRSPPPPPSAKGWKNATVPCGSVCADVMGSAERGMGACGARSSAARCAVLASPASAHAVSLPSGGQAGGAAATTRPPARQGAGPVLRPAHSTRPWPGAPWRGAVIQGRVAQASQGVGCGGGARAELHFAVRLSNRFCPRLPPPGTALVRVSVCAQLPVCTHTHAHAHARPMRGRAMRPACCCCCSAAAPLQ